MGYLLIFGSSLYKFSLKYNFYIHIYYYRIAGNFFEVQMSLLCYFNLDRAFSLICNRKRFTNRYLIKSVLYIDNFAMISPFIFIEIN